MGASGEEPGFLGLLRAGQVHFLFPITDVFGVGVGLTGMKLFWNREGTVYADFFSPGVFAKLGRFVLGASPSWFRQLDGHRDGIVDWDVVLAIPLAVDGMFENNGLPGLGVPGLQLSCTVASEEDYFCGVGIQWLNYQRW